MHNRPLFQGTVTNGATKYVPVPIFNGAIGAHIAWRDATSSAAITLELGSFDSDEAPVETAGTYQWVNSGAAITGPSATAAGSVLVNIDNVRQKRARLKIVAAANCDFDIRSGI